MLATLLAAVLSSSSSLSVRTRSPDAFEGLHENSPSKDPTGEMEKQINKWNDKHTPKAAQPLQTNGYGSLCIQGKLVPRLYVLGAQKCATTSLSFDLVEAGIHSAAGNNKEWHMLQKGPDRSTWLAQLPDCPNNASVLADFSPSNLVQTNLPDDVHVSRGWPWGGLDGVDHSRDLMNFPHENVPEMIRSFYGDDGIQDLVFVIMLREPLARMQSAWYGLRSPQLNAGRKSFAKDLEVTLDFLSISTPPNYLEWMWRSAYYDQIMAYLKVFKPSQFVVVPIRQYSEHSDDVVDTILHRLGTIRQEADANSNRTWVAPGGEKNMGKHPELYKDLDEGQRAAFDKVMEDKNNRLATLLAKMRNEGALLHGLTKAKGQTNAHDIHDWLVKNW